MSRQPALIVCMGVSGCGKTTVARNIADHLGLAFFEADDFHSEENKARMAAGKPLDDAMRKPWIQDICTRLQQELTKGNDCVLACSALRRSHRDSFRTIGFRTRFLFLDGDRELVEGWMQEREDHFMPTSLLDSQFAALESPTGESDVTLVPITNNWKQTTELALDEARSIASL
jgi:gluconokinase